MKEIDSHTQRDGFVDGGGWMGGWMDAGYVYVCICVYGMVWDLGMVWDIFVPLGLGRGLGGGDGDKYLMKTQNITRSVQGMVTRSACLSVCLHVCLGCLPDLKRKRQSVLELSFCYSSIHHGRAGGGGNDIYKSWWGTHGIGNFPW